MTASATVDTGERPVLITITPCRLMDSRDGTGGRSTPLGANETFALVARGRCGIPADAVALSMSVATVDPTASSFVTVFPADAARPFTANMVFTGGSPPIENAVTSRLSGDGRVAFYNLAGTVHLVVDVVGYYVDHTHDDRYYTKAQVDAHRVRFAIVAPNGTVFASSGGVTARHVTAGVGGPDMPGKYVVEFGSNVLNCAYSATPGTGVPGLFESNSFKFTYIEASPLSTTSVGVYTFDVSETPADRAFHLTVIC
jgi:hypothetical protein